MSWTSPSELTDRRERGRELCRRLCQDVASIAPAGIGRWGRAWEIVDPPSADFMVVLFRWEQTGDDAERPALKAAYRAVLDAWRDAAAEYEREVAGR